MACRNPIRSYLTPLRFSSASYSRISVYISNVDAVNKVKRKAGGAETGVTDECSSFLASTGKHRGRDSALNMTRKVLSRDAAVMGDAESADDSKCTSWGVESSAAEKLTSDLSRATNGAARCGQRAAASEGGVTRLCFTSSAASSTRCSASPGRSSGRQSRGADPHLPPPPHQPLRNQRRRHCQRTPAGASAALGVSLCFGLLLFLLALPAAERHSRRGRGVRRIRIAGRVVVVGGNGHRR
jgi:hypothetical protein